MPDDLEISKPARAPIDALDFEHADRIERGGRACAQCATPITDRYFTLGSHVLCEACHLAFREAKAPGNAASRFFAAAGLGTLAAVFGCALWMIVTKLTGYEIGLIAIVVGYAVGIAVRYGSRGVGGLAYQLLAVFLTYSAIVMTYVPLIMADLQARENFQSGFEETYSETDDEFADPAVEGEGPSPPPVERNEFVESAWVVTAILLAYMLPFLGGFENIIGILIIGFALWQAFQLNARPKLDLQGPFRLEARDAPGG